MWCRRAASALQQPLDWQGFLLLGVASAGVGVAARILARRPRDWRFDCVISLGLLAWAIALSPTGARAGGLLIFWGILAGEELWAWRRALGLDRLRDSRCGLGGSEEMAQRSPAAPSRGPVADLHSPPPSDVTQEFVRTRQADGSERLAGWLRVPLSPGQRTATAHLAFCPPFARTPKTTVSQQEGPPARIKEAQLFPYGARFDLKLVRATDAPATVLLEVTVQGEAPMLPAPPAGIAVAVVRHGDSVLVGRRPEGAPLAGLWEFPGGKILPAESPETAAARECLEETGLEIRVGRLLSVVEQAYEHGPVRLHFFAAEAEDPGQPPAAPFAWVAISDLAACRFPPANAGILESLARGT